MSAPATTSSPGSTSRAGGGPALIAAQSARRGLAIVDLRRLQGRPLADAAGPQGRGLRARRAGAGRPRRRGAAYLVGRVRPDGSIDDGPFGLVYPVYTASASAIALTACRSPAARGRATPGSASSAGGSSTSRSAGARRPGLWRLGLRDRALPEAGHGHGAADADLSSTLFAVGALRHRRRRARRPGDPQGPALRRAVPELRGRRPASTTAASSSRRPTRSATRPAAGGPPAAATILRQRHGRRPAGPAPLRPGGGSPAGRRGPRLAGAELLGLDQPRHIRADPRGRARRDLLLLRLVARPCLPGPRPLARGLGWAGPRTCSRADPRGSARRDLVEPVHRSKEDDPWSPRPSPPVRWGSAGWPSAPAVSDERAGRLGRRAGGASLPARMEPPNGGGGTPPPDSGTDAALEERAAQLVRLLVRKCFRSRRSAPGMGLRRKTVRMADPTEEDRARTTCPGCT